MFIDKMSQTNLGNLLNVDCEECFIQPPIEAIPVYGDDLLEIWDWATDHSWIETSIGTIDADSSTIVYFWPMKKEAK